MKDNNLDPLNYELEDEIDVLPDNDEQFSSIEEAKIFANFKDLYKEYLSIPLNNPEKRNKLGRKIVDTYNQHKNELSSFSGTVDKIVDEIKWRTEETTSSLKRLNEAFVSLSSAKEIELIKNQDDKKKVGFFNSTFLSIGKHFKKYSKAMSYVSIYLVDDGYAGITRIILIRFENFSPIEILDSDSSPLTIEEITNQIEDFIKDDPLVLFDASKDLELMSNYNIDLSKINTYSEKDLLVKNEDITAIENYTLEEVADYYVFDYDKDNPREACYIIGRLFENVINNITDKRDRYLD